MASKIKAKQIPHAAAESLMIELGWSDFRSNVIKGNPRSPVEIENMRKLFFCGAAFMFWCAKVISGECSGKDHAICAAGIQNEMDEFEAELKQEGFRGL